MDSTALLLEVHAQGVKCNANLMFEYCWESAGTCEKWYKLENSALICLVTFKVSFEARAQNLKTSRYC